MMQRVRGVPGRRGTRRVREIVLMPGLALMVLFGTAQAGAGSSETQPAAETSTQSVADQADGAAVSEANLEGRKKRRASRQELDARLDALLAEALAADEYRQSRRCLSRTAYRKIEVLNEEYVLFSKGEDHWINRLRRRCPSLKFNHLPVFVQKGTSTLCESDPFYPTNTMDLNMSLSGSRSMGMQGICYLGDFEQISAEQAALIRGS